MRKLGVLFGFCLVSGLTQPAFAAHDQMYGLGGSSSGRVGSVTADSTNVFASLLNPALLAAAPERLFAFNLGGISTHVTAPANVLLDSRKYRTRDGLDRLGQAHIPDVRTAMMAAGYAHPIALGFWPNHRMGIGLSLSGPIGQFRRWIALSPYDFTLLRYGAADTQFKGTLSGSLELVPKMLFIGGGVSIFMTSNGITEASLTAENQVGRMAMDIAFNTAGVVGLYGVFGRTTAAAVWRQQVNPVLQQTFMGSAQMGDIDFANQPAAAQSSMYYEPAVLEFEIQQAFDQFVLSAGVGFQQWSQYRPRYLVLATRDANGNERGTTPAIVPMRDTWNPRASLEWRGWRNWKLSAGYQFRPSAVTDLTGPGNLIDMDTHVAGFSFQHEMGNLLFFERLSLGAYAQAHWMGTRSVTKADPSYIGAPGYQMSGRALVFGGSLTSLL